MKANATSLAQRARLRLKLRPPPPESPAALQARIDVVEALIDRDQRRAKAALALFAPKGPATQPTHPLDLAKQRKGLHAP